jgi:hypothetical protein
VAWRMPRKKPIARMVRPLIIGKLIFARLCEVSAYWSLGSGGSDFCH